MDTVIQRGDRAMIGPLVARASAKGRRFLAHRFARDMVRVAPRMPLVSFTFDDAPVTAFGLGRAILESHGARGTYFVSLGLLGAATELGVMATAPDLARAVDAGHELGCHTYDHLDAWKVTTREFMASVAKNSEALHRVLGMRFATFSYPKSGPTLAVKSEVARLFECCRGGGQVANFDVVDRNLVRSYFIARHNSLDLADMKRVIDMNAARRGWLVFATHDIADSPSVFGCQPRLFEDVVAYAARSGAALVPMRDAFAALDGGPVQR